MSFNKDLSHADFDEINDLLLKLTPEELEQLNNEVDPDDDYLPARDRVRDQTKKQPTGKFDREKLIKFLEDQGKSEADWDVKPFVKETRGKVYQPPAKQQEEFHDDVQSLHTEWDDLLANASESEIVELAALLGFTGLVNQVQFHSANSVGSNSIVTTIGGWNAAAKAEQLKFIPPEQDNKTDVDDSLSKVVANDPSLTQLNLNNIKNISVEKLQQLIEGMTTNTNLKNLSLSNVELPDTLSKHICDMLEANTTLITLNLESNHLSPATLADICRSLNKNQTLIDLRLSNQRASVLGNKVEMDIANTVALNTKLLRLGLHFSSLGPRVKVQETFKRNWDLLRKERVAKNKN